MSFVKPPRCDFSFDLPIELKTLVVDYLCLADVIRLRLASKAWSVAGTKGLYRDGIFKLRPHRNDLAHFELLCEYEWFSRRIAHVKIFVGDVDWAGWKDRIVSEKDCYRCACCNEFPTRNEKMLAEYEYDCPFPEGGDRYMGLPQIRKSGYKRIAIAEKLHGRVKYYADRHCVKDILSRVFSRLPNLKVVSATSIEYPFQGRNFGCLRAQWRRRFMYRLFHEFYDHKFAQKAYSSILEAILSLERPITTLILDCIPVECIQSLQSSRAQKKNSSEIERHPHMEVFEALKIAKFGIKLTHGFPRIDPPLDQSLGSFFRSMRNLRDLDLTLHPCIHIRESSRAVTKGIFFGGEWPYLESLRLSRLSASQEDLLPLIYRHRSTLRNLGLRGMNILTDGVYTSKIILEGFRDRLKLERLEFMIGSCRRLEFPYDENWALIDPNHLNSSAGKLEAFVLGKTPWPMMDDCIYRGYWRHIDRDI